MSNLCVVRTLLGWSLNLRSASTSGSTVLCSTREMLRRNCTEYGQLKVLNEDIAIVFLNVTRDNKKLLLKIEPD